MKIGCGIAGALLIVATATGSSAADPDMTPASLKPPVAQTLTLSAHGIGVQIYTCQPATDDATSFAWTLTAPDAKITDPDGKPIGKHYAGPTWEANDGSKVVGEVVARDDGPDSSAIPWLLLRAKSTQGAGRFSAITWIQRVHTVGGKAPDAGCNATAAGREQRVSYSADYNFFAPHR